MKKVIIVAFVALLALSTVGLALAEHENGPGNSTFGRCTALLNGNGENKYEHGNAFRVFDHIDDGDDGTDDFTEASN